VDKLNAWKDEQLAEWRERPKWETIPTASSFEAWLGRGGQALINHGTPGATMPTVIYDINRSGYDPGNKQSPTLHRKMDPAAQVRLQDAGIRTILNGHSPYGHIPQVTSDGPISTVWADTSFNKDGENVHNVLVTPDGDVSLKGRATVKTSDGPVEVTYDMSRDRDASTWPKLGKLHFLPEDTDQKDPWVLRGFLEDGKVIYFQQKGFAMNYLIGEDECDDLQSPLPKYVE